MIAGNVTGCAGIVAGNGALFLLTSYWWRGWERRNHSRLPREPRWNWSASERFYASARELPLDR